MNNPLIKDQLAWDRFFDESSKRETYPPKKIELFNRLVAYTNNFFLIAATGAFTPGYLMLITKKLIPSHSMIEEKHVDELKWLIEVISKAISKTYKKETVTFEHGNCACLGGLDRAHLHIMTINEKANNDLITKCINQTLINRKAGITSVEINGSKLENIHDINEIMNSPKSNFCKVNGKQLLYKDICNSFDINNWPISTKKHVQNNGQYVYFKTSSPSTSFLTDKNFQTQLGRQIVFEIEKETNNDIKNMSKEILKKNNYANIWKWQEFSFNENMLKTMSDLIPTLLDIKNDKFNFLTFEKK